MSNASAYVIVRVLTASGVLTRSCQDKILPRARYGSILSLASVRPEVFNLQISARTRAYFKPLWQLRVETKAVPFSVCSGSDQYPVCRSRRETGQPKLCQHARSQLWPDLVGSRLRLIVRANSRRDTLQRSLSEFWYGIYTEL